MKNTEKKKNNTEKENCEGIKKSETKMKKKKKREKNIYT